MENQRTDESPQIDEAESHGQVVTVSYEPTEEYDIPQSVFGGYQKEAVDEIIDDLQRRNRHMDARLNENLNIIDGLNRQVNTATAAARRYRQEHDKAQMAYEQLKAEHDDLIQERDKAVYDAKHVYETVGKQQQAFVDAAHKDAERIRIEAQQAAEQMRKNAETQAEQTMKKAQHDSQQIMASASQSAKDMVAAAQNKVDDLTRQAQQQSKQAKSQSQRLVEQAHSQAEKIVKDAREQEDAIKHQCAQRIADAQTEVKQVEGQRDAIWSQLKQIVERLNDII